MQLSRRHFLKSSLALALCGMVPGVAQASLAASRPMRKLHLYNTHTAESLKVVYWEKGVYHPQALKEIAHLLRDHRTGDIHPIDPRLLDLLASLHRRMDSAKPFEIISGYRSPRTNAMLHATSSGVAKDSLHMEGRAIDIRLTDRPLSALRDMALDLEQGGVGYYPASDFVHVDTGRVRQW